VTYVADTHALIFFATTYIGRMSRRCARIFRRAEQERDRVHIPVICFFELAHLFERGRMQSRLGFEHWQALVAQFPGLTIAPLLWEDIREARGLGALIDHRLMAGTAIRLDAPLTTNDARIRRSGLLRTLR